MFKNVKLLLCYAPVLSVLCLDESFKLQVEASQVGAGAVLLLEKEGIDRPVCSFSTKFYSYHHNYSTIKKEALAHLGAPTV